jgi:hypothetical protein
MIEVSYEDTDRTAQIISRIKGLREYGLHVGIFEEPLREGSNLNNAEIANILENGGPNLPARPFIQPGLAESRAMWLEHLKEAGAAILDGNKRRAKNQIHAAGQAAVNGIQNKILTGPFAPLSAKYVQRSRWRRPGRPSTGRTGIPLLDTGQLFNSIDFRVRGRE